MKIAVFLFGQEVSPRFGCSGQVLVASVQDGGLASQQVTDVSCLAPWQLPDFLASLGVEKVVCGGIHRRHQMELERRGIEVIWGVIGPASQAVAALLDGTLRSDQFVCPSRGRGRGWRHRGPRARRPGGRGPWGNDPGVGTGPGRAGTV